MVSNYLFVEPILINKLRADIPAFVNVSGAAALDALDRENPITPCAYVIYAGDEINTSIEATGGIGRHAQFVTQIWSVVICTYLSDGRGIGEGASTAAGELITSVFDSLCGFSPDPARCKPIARHASPIVPDYGVDNYCFYVLNFRVQFTNKFK